MGLRFEVRNPAADEVYPEDLKDCEITDYLCQIKAEVLSSNLPGDAVLLTADTIVWQNDSVLEKPTDNEEARRMLRRLSGTWHEVYTSICLLTSSSRDVACECTRVRFAELDESAIGYYLQNGHPLDKAGAYGIQEWIGLVGVEEIRGSYTNVVGLPTRLVCQKLADMVRRGF